MNQFFLLLFAASLNGFANISIKRGMMNLNLIEKEFSFEMMKKIVMNPWLMVGVAAFVGTLVAYAAVLSKMNLSLAYPLMTSIGFVIVTIVSILFFKETVTINHFFGLLAVIAGIWLVAQA